MVGTRDVVNHYLLPSSLLSSPLPSPIPHDWLYLPSSGLLWERSYQTRSLTLLLQVKKKNTATRPIPTSWLQNSYPTENQHKKPELRGLPSDSWYPGEQSWDWGTRSHEETAPPSPPGPTCLSRAPPSLFLGSRMTSGSTDLMSDEVQK